LKKFFTFYSKHHSIYILNISSYQLLLSSLEFYTPTNIFGKIKYVTLLIFLNIIRFIPFLRKRILKDKNELEDILTKLNKGLKDYKIRDNSSILISPTKEKIVINYGNGSYEKIGFFSNYQKIKNEAKAYRYLNELNINNFVFPQISDEKDDGKKYSFKISNNFDETKLSSNLYDGLLEFFTKSEKRQVSFYSYIEKLYEDLKKNKIEIPQVFDYLNNVKVKYSKSQVNLGFVHGDFKKANMIFNNNKILIFDFEEALFFDIPLLDFYNYLIDPMILNQSPQKIKKYLFRTKNISLYENYLKKINEDINYETFLSLYLIKKIIFYKVWGYEYYQRKFINLFIYINE